MVVPALHVHVQYVDPSWHEQTSQIAGDSCLGLETSVPAAPAQFQRRCAACRLRVRSCTRVHYQYPLALRGVHRLAESGVGATRRSCSMHVLRPKSSSSL